MGGTMWVESAGPGHGLDLPLHDPRAAAELPPRHAARLHRPAAAAARASASWWSTTTPPTARILALQTAKWGMAVQDTESPDAGAADARAPQRLRPGDPRHAHAGAWTARRWPRASARPGTTLPLVLFSSLGRTEARRQPVRRHAGQAAAPEPAVRHAGARCWRTTQCRAAAAPPAGQAAHGRRHGRSATRCASCWPRTTW